MDESRIREQIEDSIKGHQDKVNAINEKVIHAKNIPM